MNEHAAGAVVVTFALPDESRAFAAILTDRRVERGGPLPIMWGELAGCRVGVYHTGVGASASARERLAHFLADAGARAVVSAGYAGGLQPGMRVGELVLADNVSSPALLERARTHLAGESLHVGTLSTAAEAVETAAGKAALHAATGALAVDMETAWIAEVCAAAGLPLLALRVVSDDAGQDFPVPGRVLFDAVRQRPRYLALPAWLAVHPGRIMPFVRFVRGLGPAQERLARGLRRVLGDL